MENCLFILDEPQELGAQLAQSLSLRSVPFDVREFENGEHKLRSSEALWGKRAFIFCSLYGDHRLTVNDKLCRLLFFLGSVKDSGAERVELLVPYLCYSRKDRRSKPQDPVCTRSLAQLLESVGVSSVWTLDIHNRGAFENAFRVPAYSLDTQSLFVDQFASRLKGKEVAVISPDSGGVKRAERFRVALEKSLGREIGKGFVEKHRRDSEIWGHTLVGDVVGKVVVLFDDLISSGSTLAKAAQACLEQGATRVLAGATHGIFEERANEVLGSESLSEILISDSIAPFKISSQTVRDKLTIVPSLAVWEEALKPII